MTVLERKGSASGVEKRSFGLGSYVVVGLLSAAIGVGAVTGFRALSGSSGMSPADISQVRAAEYGQILENQWIAQVNATRNADLIDYYAGLHAATVTEINAQRADDLVAYLEGQNLARVAEIQAQRAQDMVQFYGGAYGPTPAEIEALRGQDMVEYHAGMYDLTPAEIETRRGQDMVTFKRGWEGDSSR